jgi:hypothetical protein
MATVYLCLKTNIESNQTIVFKCGIYVFEGHLLLSFSNKIPWPYQLNS